LLRDAFSHFDAMAHLTDRHAMAYTSLYNNRPV